MTTSRMGRGGVRFAALCLWLVSVGLVCSYPLPAQRTGSVPAHSVFRISGVVVSARDGSPVPFARLQASQVPVGLADSAVRQPQSRDSVQIAGANRPPGADNRPENPAFAPFGRAQAGADLNATTADNRGRFSLTVARAGGWRLTASARGFRSQAIDEHEGFSSAVVLTDANPTYSLTFPLLPSASLTGVVLDEAGEPVERAQVFAELVPPKSDTGNARQGFRNSGVASTDDRGRYEIANLAEGEYRVRVQAMPWYAQNAGAGGLNGNPRGSPAAPAVDPSLDFVYPPTWFPGTTDEHSAEIVPLAAGDEREVDIRMTAVAAVHLQVPLPQEPPAVEGQPRNFNPGVTITRISDGGFDMGLSVGRSNAQPGVGESGSLAPGHYQIRLGGSAASRFGFDGNDDNADVREIDIAPGASGTINIADAVPLIHVKVALESTTDTAGIGVLFTNVETGRRITSVAPQRFQRRGRRGQDSDGTGEDAPAPAAGRTALLPAGTWAVALQSATAYLTTISGSGAVITGRTVKVTGGQPAITLHIETGRANVVGVVLSGDKLGDKSTAKPLTGAMVELVPATLGQSDAIDATYRDQSNTDGSFLMSSVLPGRYILIAIDRGWKIDWHDPAVLAKYLEHGVPLDLHAGDRVQHALLAQQP